MSLPSRTVALSGSALGSHFLASVSRRTRSGYKVLHTVYMQPAQPNLYSSLPRPVCKVFRKAYGPPPPGEHVSPRVHGDSTKQKQNKRATFTLGWHSGPQSMAHRAVKGNWLLTTKTSDKFLHRAHNQTHPKPNHVSLKYNPSTELKA